MPEDLSIYSTPVTNMMARETFYVAKNCIKAQVIPQNLTNSAFYNTLKIQTINPDSFELQSSQFFKNGIKTICLGIIRLVHCQEED